MYTAVSIDVFIAAYAGALGGMRSFRGVSQNTNPAHFTHLSNVALAFAEAFDTEYANPLPNDLQLEDIESICSEQMSGKQPGGSGPTTAAFWVKPVKSIIALLSEADSVVAANVTNPIPFPSPSAGIPVIQLRTVVGATNSLKSTIPATGIAAIVDGYTTVGDGGGDPFFWNATSTATDNASTVINPTGHVGAGRWVRIFSGAISAIACGAVADATTRSDAAITGNAVSSASGGFTTALIGKSFVGEGAMFRPLTGTLATTNARRGVAGTGTIFETEVWEGSPVTISGTTFHVSQAPSGTVDTGIGSVNVLGHSTFFTNEYHVGQEIQIANDRKYLVATITDDTHLTLDRTAPATLLGATVRFVKIDDLHLLLDANATATAAGLTARGTPNPLITTITAVPTPTTLTLAGAADIAVTGARAWIGTDSVPAMVRGMNVGDVFLPSGAYLFATSWHISQPTAQATWMPGAKAYVANRIELAADGAKLYGPASGFMVVALDQAQIEFIGGTSLRDTPLVISGIAPGSNDNVVSGMFLYANGHVGGTGMCIGRLGPIPTSGNIIQNCNVFDFKWGVDIGGWQTGILENLFVYNVIGRNNGRGLQFAAYLGPDMASPQCVVATARTKGGLVGSYGTNVTIGNEVGFGAVTNLTIENIFVGGNLPQAFDLDFLVKYSQDVVIKRSYVVHSEQDSRFAVQVGAPSAASGTHARADGFQLRETSVAGYVAPIVGYSWDAPLFDANTLGCQTNAFANYGNTYYRKGGVWHRPIAASYTLDPTTDLSDVTGFDEVDALNFSGGLPAPTFSLYAPLFHADTIVGTKTIRDATNVTTGAWSFSVGTSLFSAGASFIWQTDPGNFAFFKSDIGLFVLTPTPATAIAPLQMLNYFMRGAYWDGVTSQDYPFSISQYIFDRGVISGIFRGAVEFVQAKPADAHTAGITFGLGATTLQEMYIGPAGGGDPTLSRCLFAMGQAAPEGVFPAIPGSIRTGPLGQIYTKYVNNTAFGWVTAYDPLIFDNSHLPLLTAGIVGDNTGGANTGVAVDVTTAGLADPSKINDNFATLISRINQFNAALISVMGFNANFYPGCFLWLNAGNGFTPAAWTDLSGAGNTLTQAVVGQQPTAVTGRNGQPAAKFLKASSQTLDKSGVNPIAGGPYTIYMVVESVTTANGDVFIGIDNGVGLLIKNNGTLLDASHLGIADHNDGLVVTGTFQILTFTRAAGAPPTLRINGTPTALSDATPGLTSSPAGHISLASQNGVAGFGDIVVSEVIAYNQARTAPESGHIEAYLKAKYNL